MNYLFMAVQKEAERNFLDSSSCGNFSSWQRILGNRRTVLLLRVERLRRRRDFGSQKKDTGSDDGKQYISGRVQGRSRGSDAVSKDR